MYYYFRGVKRTMREQFKTKGKLVLSLAVSLVVAACSGLQPPDAGGPRANQPAYPVVLAADAARLQEALVFWQRLAQPQTGAEKAQVTLHPYTATIEGLPPHANLMLPKVGSGPTMSEEETRESLRRFIQEWQGLIGAEPIQLSLRERTDQPDGSKLATYEQQPFRFPLRGPYGKLRIRFTAERRVVDFSSTCIPHADRLQASIAAVTPQIGWEDATARVANMSVSFGSGPGQASYTISPANKPNVRELVVYAKDTANGPLELRLAWEIAVTNAPFQLVYVDAVKGDFLATA